MTEEITVENYSQAIIKLLKLAKAHCRASKAAATCLLSSYNGNHWQLDVTDLCHLDADGYEAALMVINCRVILDKKPNMTIENGDDIFCELGAGWYRYNSKNRAKDNCHECRGRNHPWGYKDDSDKSECTVCEGVGFFY